MTTLGIDVSSFQNPDAALLSGKAFCIIKMTQGTSYINPNRAQWLSVARGAGVTVGGYHFMDSGSAATQADYYLSHLPGTVDWHALDVENSSDGLDWAGRAAFILDWASRISATGKPVLVYMNRSWLNSIWNAATPDQRTQLAKYPLWFADYTGAAGSYGGSIPSAWPVAIHQYSESPIDQDALLTTITVQEDDMAITDDDATKIAQAVLNLNVSRQGGPTGTTNLGATIAWLDSNMNSTRDIIKSAAAAVPSAVLNANVTRQGLPSTSPLAGKTTNLGAVVAWSDANLAGVVGSISSAISTEVGKVATGGIDEDALKTIISDALASAFSTALTNAASGITATK